MSNGTVNKVILVGRLGAKPELKQTQGGMSVVTVSLATNSSYTDKASGNRNDITDWHRLVFWGRLAENLEKYSNKGDSIYVEGRLQNRKWQDQNGQDRYTTEISVAQMQFLSRSQSSTDNSYQSPNNSSSEFNNNSSNNTSSDNFNFDQDDDIPF